MIHLLNFISGIGSAFMPLAINSVKILADSLEDQSGLLEENGISTFAELAHGLSRVMKDIVGPVMIAIGAVLAILLIKIGIDYAKAENAEKRKEKIGQLVGVGVGLLIILVGIALCYSINWIELYASMTGHRHKFEPSENYSQFCEHCGEKANSLVHGS